jgi:hypothetical protein
MAITFTVAALLLKDVAGSVSIAFIGEAMGEKADVTIRAEADK